MVQEQIIRKAALRIPKLIDRQKIPLTHTHHNRTRRKLLGMVWEEDRVPLPSLLAVLHQTTCEVPRGSLADHHQHRHAAQQEKGPVGSPRPLLCRGNASAQLVH